MTRKINWAEVTKQIKEQETKKFNSNPEFEKETWKANAFNPILTDAGTYECVIRFVPRPEGDGSGIPYVREYRHGFQGPTGQWLIEPCPQTHGKDCPVCKENTKLWKTIGDAARDKQYGKKTNYFSNILVVKDPQNPENEGKVFIYRYGKKIHEKIMEKLVPAEGSIDDPVDVYDYENGMNFKLKIRKVKSKIHGRDVEYNNYDSSTFTGTVTSLTKKQVEDVENKLFNLGTIIDISLFKSFEDLTERFDKVVNGVTTSRPSVVDNVDDDSDEESTSSTSVEDSETSGDSEDDDDFFNRLRKGGK